jgi:hypothetical protein
MKIWRQFAAWVLVWSLLLSVACKKKKPQLPPQAQAPTVAVDVPDEISEATPPPAPPKKEEAPPPEPQKPPSKPRRKKKPPTPPASTPDTTANANGNSTVAAAHPPANPAGAPDTAIAAGVSNAQLNQQKQTTAELLAAAEKNLQSVNRNLNHDEQAMVAQIKTYIDQSQKATKENDFERAYNLATKARLLSDALVKK